MAAAAPQTPNPDPSVFEYPPLPEGVDAIRVLTVEPGGFADHVVCGLVPVAFSAKPRYTALSYTWQDPYPHWENESEKTLPPSPAAIVLNGRPFAVQPNLFLALVHLRSPKHALALWVDAVCINQADPEERDCQVAIMSFIYTRALLVAVWLGPKVHGAQTDQLRRMHTDWKMGEARLLAASIHDTDKQLLHYSAEPDAATADRIAASAYWTRLWIVQELCLPQRLVFVYGAVLWRYEDLARWDVVREARNADPSGTCAKTQHSSVGAGLAAIVQLIATRDARHSDRLRLERLVERFARSRCS
ncbi:heterokaryon incompatibility protein-domain-containing protein, partial [Lasiosphaeria miniovina]